MTRTTIDAGRAPTPLPPCGLPGLLAPAVLVCSLAVPLHAQEESARDVPTEAGFGAVVEAMQAGAYDGLETLKAFVAPREAWGRNGGMPTWSVMPMEGLEVDLDGALSSMASFGSTTGASYAIRRSRPVADDERPGFEAEFELLRGWLVAHAGEWVVDETIEPVSWRLPGSRRAALVPGPTMAVRRIDGKPVPRIELWLRETSSDAGEDWAIGLDCSAQGSPAEGAGTAAWLDPYLAEREPLQDLPPLRDDLVDVVLALVADAPDSFAHLRAPGEPRDDEVGDSERRVDDPIVPPFEPRWPLTVHLLDAPDPSAVRDCVTAAEDDRRSDASARLGLLSIPAPTVLTRRAVDARLAEVHARLVSALPGWRSRVFDVPAGMEDFHERVALLEGLRGDGHPVWIVLERMSYPRSLPGEPYVDTLQLSLTVSTDHRVTVGYDLLTQWRAELADGREPLASAVRELGDPLAGRLLEGDRVVPPDGRPYELPELLGVGGEDELQLVLVRDGHYDELKLAPPRLSLARWKELQAACDAGELPPAALALLGSRLATDEVVELVHALVAAGEDDFAQLPPEHAGWLVRTDERQLATVAIPLWDASEAPTPAFVDVLRAGLAHAFDDRWRVDAQTRNSGPFWDWLARQTHWSAHPEGPEGTHPWVELAESTRDERVQVELEVHAFSSAHRLADAEHPERLWFEPIGGDCVDGRGVAYCYREKLPFDGPFVGGLPDGEGRQIFSDGTAHTGALYEQGRMRLMGYIRPAPPTQVQSIDELRWQAATPLREQTLVSDWMDAWADVFDFAEIDPVPEPASRSESDGGWRFRTCVGCNGSGESWHTYEVEDVSDTMVLSGTSLWRQGYDTIRTHHGTRTVSEIGPCGFCNGTGRQRY